MKKSLKSQRLKVSQTAGQTRLPGSFALKEANSKDNNYKDMSYKLVAGRDKSMFADLSHDHMNLEVLMYTWCFCCFSSLLANTHIEYPFGPM